MIEIWEADAQHLKYRSFRTVAAYPSHGVGFIDKIASVLLYVKYKISIQIIENINS